MFLDAPRRVGRRAGNMNDRACPSARGLAARAIVRALAADLGFARARTRARPGNVTGPGDRGYRDPAPRPPAVGAGGSCTRQQRPSRSETVRSSSTSSISTRARWAASASSCRTRWTPGARRSTSAWTSSPRTRATRTRRSWTRTSPRAASRSSSSRTAAAAWGAASSRGASSRCLTPSATRSRTASVATASASCPCSRSSRSS